MRVDQLPGTANVVRFPVERRARPTLDLLCEVEPDVREILNMAEAFGMDPPAPDLRDLRWALTGPEPRRSVQRGAATASPGALATPGRLASQAGSSAT